MIVKVSPIVEILMGCFEFCQGVQTWYFLFSLYFTTLDLIFWGELPGFKPNLPCVFVHECYDILLFTFKHNSKAMHYLRFVQYLFLKISTLVASLVVLDFWIISGSWHTIIRTLVVWKMLLYICATWPQTKCLAWALFNLGSSVV